MHGQVVHASFRRSLSQRAPERLKRLKYSLRRARSSTVEPVQMVLPRQFRNVSTLRKHLWWNTTRVGLVELLRYADRNSMAHSREVRLPFLDHRLVEFVFKMPDRLFIRDGWTKWILREAFRGIVPPVITDRVDKIGFMPPQQQWLGALAWTDVMIAQLQKTANQGPNPTTATELALLPG